MPDDDAPTGPIRRRLVPLPMTPQRAETILREYVLTDPFTAPLIQEAATALLGHLARQAAETDRLALRVDQHRAAAAAVVARCEEAHDQGRDWVHTETVLGELLDFRRPRRAAGGGTDTGSFVARIVAATDRVMRAEAAGG